MTPKHFFFGVLGTIVVAIGASGYGYFYAVKRLEAAKTALATSQGEQAADQAQIDGLTQMKVLYAKEVVPELPLMNTALPRTKDQTALLVQLRAVATNRGLTISSISFTGGSSGLPSNTSQTTAAAGAVLALPISFDVQGSFAQLQAFLIDLEHLNRFTNVTSLTVSRADPTKPIDYSISLSAYVKP